MNFDEWFEIFWQTYPKDLLYATKGPKDGPFKTKLRKLVKDEKMAQEVLESLRAQIKYSRKLKSQGEPSGKWNFPMVSVWCNQQRWTTEIPSHTEIAKPGINQGAYKSNVPVLPQVNKTEAQAAIDAMKAVFNRKKEIL